MPTQIRVLGSDLSPLLEDIDPSQLPVECGGTYTGPYGPMYSQTDDDLRTTLGFVSLNLAAGETRAHDHRTTGEGYLCWTWHTTAHNVKCTVEYVAQRASSGTPAIGEGDSHVRSHGTTLYRRFIADGPGTADAGRSPTGVGGSMSSGAGAGGGLSPTLDTSGAGGDRSAGSPLRSPLGTVLGSAITNVEDPADHGECTCTSL